jgi:hypothetical protein
LCKQLNFIIGFDLFSKHNENNKSKALLHWQSLLQKNTDDSNSGCNCLGILGKFNTNSIVPICVATPKKPKASTTIVPVIGVIVQQTLPV